MKITVVGTGYVGLVTGACFAETGLDVTCTDTDQAKIELLNNGVMPIYEPGLSELVTRNVSAGRLHFTTDLGADIEVSDVVFCAVGTPAGEDGSADVSNVREVARTIGKAMKSYLIVVTKSTVPVGTADLVRETIRKELEVRGIDTTFDVASNPEFLKEGDAVNDFMRPDRVVVGIESERARETMERLYKPFMLKSYRIIFTDLRSAEMIKYASNAMLATRISFMNEIANLCELTGADVNMVRKGVGSDSRIGNKFLYPGIGYGGSCFPKDLKALIATAKDVGYGMRILEAVDSVNNEQKSKLFEKLSNHFDGKLEGKTVAVWGLSYKPETSDIREAPSLILIDLLLEAGCSVRVYDPAAMEEARSALGDIVEYCRDPYEAVSQADGVMLVTEWKVFRQPLWDRVRASMRTPVVLDGRNIYDREEMQGHGFIYYRIG